MPVTVFLRVHGWDAARVSAEGFDWSLSIVAETEQIADRRNSSLKSGARISDGSRRRFFVVRRKNSPRQINALPWSKIIEWE
jgi:hypothetical protein